jgi:MFS family permease
MLSSSCFSLGSIRNRNESSARYVILFAVVLSKICVWYSYSLPFAMVFALDEHMGSDENYEFYYGLLFSVYAFPNIVLPLIGGYFVDSYGSVLCSFVFSIFIFIGSVLFAAGVAQKSWPLMLIGRTFFGVGGENIQVADSTVLTVYFAGKEIALAFSLTLSASPAGIAISGIATAAILESSIILAAWMGAILTGINSAILFVSYLIDLRLERQIQITAKGSELLDPVVSSEKPATDTPIFSFQDLKSLPKIFWIISFLIFSMNGKIFQAEEILYY